MWGPRSKGIVVLSRGSNYANDKGEEEDDESRALSSCVSECVARRFWSGIIAKWYDELEGESPETKECSVKRTESFKQKGETRCDGLASHSALEREREYCTGDRAPSYREFHTL